MHVQTETATADQYRNTMLFASYSADVQPTQCRALALELPIDGYLTAEAGRLDLEWGAF